MNEYLLRDGSPFKPLTASPFQAGLCDEACKTQFASIVDESLLADIDAGKHTRSAGSEPLPYTVLHAISGGESLIFASIVIIHAFAPHSDFLEEPGKFILPPSFRD